MGGRGEPPEGVPEGVPGGDDEFRSVVFDESFVRAARIQELSARERMNAAAHPVRPRPALALPRQALALMLLIAMAFAGAVYLGIRHPYRETVDGGIELSMSVVPLAPGGPATERPGASVPGPGAASGAASVSGGRSGRAAVPGATVSATAPAARAASATASAAGTGAAGASADPFAGTPVAGYAVGPAGIALPNASPTAHFTPDEVLRALSTVQRYLMESSLLPDVLLGSGTGGVRDLLDPLEKQQFDESLAHPADDQRHEITGWLVRFDPAQVRLAAQQVRVAGAVRFRELDAQTLEVSSDHTFVYALRPATGGSGAAGASAALLFAVRREISYRFSHADIAGSRLELADSVTQAGPMSCDADTSSALRPLFPVAVSAPPSGAAPSGAAPSHAASAPRLPVASTAPSRTAGRAPAPTALPSGLGIDPLDHSAPAWHVCGMLGGPAL